jgi:ADP-ribose pyrophosphatase YjhB (NUDIX family)
VSIRNAAKALILDDGKLLLNKCLSHNNEIFYTIPGGGQIQFETMEEAVIRECFEETGYKIKPQKFIALYEEIVMDEDLQRLHPDYTHRIFHVFLCHLLDKNVYEPTEKDVGQIGMEWIRPEEVMSLNFNPRLVQRSIVSLLESETPMFLGSVREGTSQFFAT